MIGTRRQATVIANRSDVAWRKLMDLRRELESIADLIDADNGEGQQVRDVSRTLGLLTPIVVAEGTRWRQYADHRTDR